jgi:hypothetical protein
LIIYGNEFAKDNIEKNLLIGHIDDWGDMFISDDLTEQLAREGSDHLGQHVQGSL